MATTTTRKWWPVCPFQPGVWLLRCAEIDYVEHEVVVEWLGEVLVAHNAHGVAPVHRWHELLTDVTWQFKEPLRAH